MATIKQQKAIEKLLENGGNVTQAMRSAGYSEASVNNPSNLTESKGYRGLLDEYGLTQQLVIQALVEDISEKKGKRLGELSLGAEILGMKKRKEDLSLSPQKHTYSMIFSPVIQDEIKIIENKIKALLTQGPS